MPAYSILIQIMHKSNFFCESRLISLYLIISTQMIYFRSLKGYNVTTKTIYFKGEHLFLVTQYSSNILIECF